VDAGASRENAFVVTLAALTFGMYLLIKALNSNQGRWFPDI
jgi:hypothetical protein